MSGMRTGYIVVIMAMAMCSAQMPPSHQQTGEGDAHGMQGGQGMGPSSRTEFGANCGIADTSMQRAMGFMRQGGDWSVLSSDSHSGRTDSTVARVWREQNWMVDIHDALGQGMRSMHTGQMCFNPQGHITYMIDRFMEMIDCGCVRFTSLTYAADGRVMRREQRFVSMTTGAEIAAPTIAQDFPLVWNFRTVEQLPFFPLIKQ
jgi:hypothetical protein